MRSDVDNSSRYLLWNALLIQTTPRSSCDRFEALSRSLFRAFERSDSSVHPPDERIDIFLAIPELTSLNEMVELPWTEPAIRIAQLEGPEEVVCLLEVGSDRVDLMNQVLHTHDAELAEVRLNNGIVGERDACLLGSLGIAAFVDELTHGFEVRVAVSDEGFDNLEHLHGSLCQANEDAIVDLEETEELESLALLGVDFVDTLDPDNEGEFRLSRDVVLAFLFGDASEADLFTLGIAVFFDVGFGALKDLEAFFLGCLRQLLVGEPDEM